MKTSKLATIKALLEGTLSLDQVVKKVKLVFTSDPLDQPLMNVADYLKANETAKTAAKKKKPSRTQPAPTPLPESPVNAPQIWEEKTWSMQDEFNFSTGTDKYSEIRRQMGMRLNRAMDQQ